MWGNVLVISMIIFYLRVFFNLLNPRNRINKKIHNEEMNKIRDCPVKTVEEQKAFLDKKYPKTEWRWKDFWFIALVWIIYIAVFIFISMIFRKLNIDISLWVAIPIVFLFPVLVNWVLRKWNLQDDDVTIFLR